MGAAASGSYQGMEIIGSRRSAASTASSFSKRLRFPCFRKKIPTSGALPARAMPAVPAHGVPKAAISP